jgi:hypothetical protein
MCNVALCGQVVEALVMGIMKPAEYMSAGVVPLPRAV